MESSLNHAENRGVRAEGVGFEPTPRIENVRGASCCRKATSIP